MDLEVESEFQKKQALKGIGIGFSFIGGFFTILGTVFGLLIATGFFIMTFVGSIFLILGIAFLRKTKDISIFDKPEITKRKIATKLGFVCKNCGRNIPGDANICPYCGVAHPLVRYQNAPEISITKMIQDQTIAVPKAPENCPSCGAHLEEGVKFCSYCGFALS